jgi:hypothetical protein
MVKEAKSTSATEEAKMDVIDRMRWIRSFKGSEP